MKRKIIIILLFVTGLLVFSYPMVSNIFASKQHVSMISEYDEKVKQLTEEALARERQKADEYNKKLNASPFSIVDPFADDQPKNSDSSYYDALNLGEVMGSLVIPKIDVKLPIYHGTSEQALSRGVGHMSNSSLPVGGLGTHTVLTGHRGMPSAKMFRHLDQLTEGDIFSIQTLGEEISYKVNKIQVVLPYETEWLSMDDNKDVATLITCEPYMINTHRLLVTGERVQPISVSTAQGMEKEHPESATEAASPKGLDRKNANWLLWVILGGIVIMIPSIFIWRRRKKLFGRM